jgi:putative heme-binding domain-containing protein
MRSSLLFSALVALAAPTTHAAPSAAESAKGANLFAVTCGSFFCHGEAGVGARGPSLRNRDFAPDFVRNTVTSGRSGTPMPSFKDSLSQAELNLVVAYVMSLSPTDHNEDTGAPAPAPVAPAAALSATAQTGQAIFFDLSRPGACAACHSYRDQGGPVGPDLSGIAKRTPRDIYQAMIAPTAPNPDYPVVSLMTDDGRTTTGFLKQKTDAVVRLYDLSSVPPVLRSLHGAKIEPTPTTPPYMHDLTYLSQEDLAALVTYLKSSDPGSKDITPGELASP